MAYSALIIIYTLIFEFGTRKTKAVLLEKVKKQEIKRKPFILTRGDRGQQVIDVFDTPDQARLAYKN